jgi:thiamine-phosphate pyrophosphorylase
MEIPANISGLYAVTPDTLDTVILLKQVEASIKGGATMVQYRNKLAPETLQYEQARNLLVLCGQLGIPLIINDNIKLCLELGADGVHLGGEDTDISTARAYLGKTRIIGASCYNRLALAIQAKKQGADYVAFGRCFNSATKPNAVNASLEIFAQAKQQVGLPTVAIGGINTENAALAIAAGADAIAVIGALWKATDTLQAAHTFSNLFYKQ